MQSTFEEILSEIHDIRISLGPIDVKLASLDHRIAEIRLLLDARFAEYETRLVGTSLRVKEQGAKLLDLLDRVNWIEAALKVPPRPIRGKP